MVKSKELGMPLRASKAMSLPVGICGWQKETGRKQPQSYVQEIDEIS